MKKLILLRDALDKLEAFKIAQGMENAGATVISICYDGERHPLGVSMPSSRFVVWGSYEPPLTTDQIDDAVSALSPEDDDPN